MVANCSDINGAAGVLTDELAARGFETRNATNGAGIDKKLERSKIYVVKGSEAVARSLSTRLGFDGHVAFRQGDAATMDLEAGHFDGAATRCSGRRDPGCCEG